MVIDVSRDDRYQDTVVCKLDAHWTWEEMAQAVRQVNRLLAEADCGHVVLLAPSNTLWGRDEIADNLKKIIPELRKSVNLVVIVGASTLTRFMLDMLGKMGIAQAFRYVRTEAEAYELIADHCNKNEA